MHSGGEKIGVRIKAPNDEVVGLRHEESFGRDGLIVLNQKGEVIWVIEGVPLCHAITDDGEVGSEEGGKGGGELRGQGEEDERVEKWEALHYLVERSPETYATEGAEEEMRFC